MRNDDVEGRTAVFDEASCNAFFLCCAAVPRAVDWVAGRAEHMVGTGVGHMWWGCVGYRVSVSMRMNVTGKYMIKACVF